MASYHTRSFSFPSNSHPAADQLDEQLRRFRSSQAASTSSLTNKLTGLNDLYKCVEEFLQLPLNQKTQHQNSFEQVLDGSLRFLDVCSSSRDVLAMSKEKLQDIQSVLRRRCSSELDITNEVTEYLKTRKTSKKIIKKALKTIKEAEQTKDNGIESMLKDVNTLTLDILKSVLSYIGGSQKSSWSFSKLVRQRAEKEPAASISDFDFALELLISQKNQSVDMSQLVNLETQIQEIDEVLQGLFRHLVKTRAILLNVISN